MGELNPGKPLETRGEDVLLYVRVQPRASRQGVVGMQAGRLKVALHSPPEKGKANAELVRLLAKRCGVSPGSVSVVSGQTSREKTVRFAGCAGASSSLRHALELDGGA